MFLSFCFSHGFYIPQGYYPVPLASELATPIQNPVLDQNGADFIDLREEDHLKAGYDKIKKPWTEEEDQKLK